MSIQMDRVHTLASRPTPTAPASTYVQKSPHSNTAARSGEKPSLENTAAGSNDEKQSQMEQSLKRSITLVIWYKVCYTPLNDLRSVTRLVNSHRAIPFV